jgi:hypothetical protein
MFAKFAPAPFLSVVIEDCKKKERITMTVGRDITPATSNVPDLEL